jgi:hypothetical protein
MSDKSEEGQPKLSMKKYWKEFLALGLFGLSGIPIMVFQFYRNYYALGLGIVLMIISAWLSRDYA